MEKEVFDQPQQNNMNSKNITITYGLVTALAMIVIGLILYFSNVSMTSWTQYLVFAVFLAGGISACMAFGKSRQGEVTFGNVFGAGFRMVAFTTIVMVGWGIITYFVLPEMKEKALEAAQESMMKQNIGADQIELSLEMSRKYYFPFMMMGIVFNYLLIGVLFSLIGAALTKKNKNPQPF
jgi:hypothetical protein